MSANLTFHAPNTATVQPITSAQYASLLASIKANSDALNFAQNGNSGGVSFDGVQFAWTFDGISVLNITIVAVHSFAAKLAGNEYIFAQLNEQFAATI
jgi:hypothetical protein